MTAPFGLKTEYSTESVVRYIATRSELKTYNINPFDHVTELIDQFEHKFGR